MTQSTPRRLTLQQRRAAFAYSQVEEIKNDKSSKEYGSLVRGLPAMIQTDGLAQTLAFLNAKGKGRNDTAHEKVYSHLQAWLSHTDQFDFSGDLLTWVLEQDSARYRMVATEALAYLGWMKRFVEARDLGDAGSARGDGG